MKSSEWARQLVKQFPKSVTLPRTGGDLDAAHFPAVEADAPALAEVLQYCATAPALECNFLECISAVDTSEEIEVIYHLFSTAFGHRVNIRVRLVRTAPALVSASPVWRAAGCYEREIAEMFGVEFKGMPNPSRLLLPDDWQGFPLRKDYVFPEAVRSIEHRREPVRKEHTRP
jgi:NADH:ubiquinone oxidoreductase subunit C